MHARTHTHTHTYTQTDLIGGMYLRLIMILSNFKVKHTHKPGIKPNFFNNKLYLGLSSQDLHMAPGTEFVYF